MTMSDKNKSIWGMIIGIILFIAIVLGATFAWFSWRSNTVTLSGTSANFEIIYNNYTGAGASIDGTLVPVDDMEYGLHTWIDIKKSVDSINGTATLKLNLSTLTLTGLCSDLTYTTPSTCSNGGGNWTSATPDKFNWAVYTDGECSNSEYSTPSTCEADSGTWKPNVLVKKGTLANQTSGSIITLMENMPLTNNETRYYIYIWLDQDVSNEFVGSIINGTITASAIQSDFGANPPELANGMIPVKYNTSTNKWVKADISNTNNDWYNYDSKIWANAVMVSNETRNSYMRTEVNTEINENDILAYYVWIPRYKYQLFNVGNKAASYTNGVCTANCPQEISIKFQSVVDTIENGTNNDEWLTHPAFWWDDDSDRVRETGEELAGLWVGKFETSAEKESICYTSPSAENCNTNDIVPRIKPNVKSLRSQQVSKQFITSQKFNSIDYLTSTDIASSDAHMAKNLEWGAVTYLSHSKYGINQEIYKNNSSYYITGRSGGNVGGSINKVAIQYPDSGGSTENEYYPPGYYTYNDYKTNYNGTISNTKEANKGMNASTTGNIYGVYDMVGGAREYVMGNFNYYSGYTAISYTAEQAKNILERTDNMAVGIWNSGYIGPVYGKSLDGLTNLSWTVDDGGIPFPESKYYDLYTVSSTTNRKLGDATGEVNNWYNDYHNFINNSIPWFIRSDYYLDDAGAGSFRFTGECGRSGNYLSFHSIFIKK